MYYESNNYLQHFGVKGMKWGVRRYRNYNGSYTKAGIKRYDKAMDTYNKRKSDYKSAKSSGEKGHQLRYKKAKIKEAERDVKKHYKHLKLDKRADEGKILYSKGYRERKAAASGKKLINASATGMFVTGTLYAGNFIDSDTAKVLSAASAIPGALSLAKKMIDANKNRKLRAYYGHTSNY